MANTNQSPGKSVWPTKMVLEAVSDLIRAPLAQVNITNKAPNRQVFISERTGLVVKIQRPRHSETIHNLVVRLKAVSMLADSGINLIASHRFQVVEKTVISVSYMGKEVKPDKIDWGWLGHTIKQIHDSQINLDPLPIFNVDLLLQGMIQDIPLDPTTDGLPPRHLIEDKIQAVIYNYKQKTKNMPRVICHGDPNLGNIIIYKNQPHLIDFDNLGLNHPLWDMAVVDNMRNFGWPAEVVEICWQSYGSDLRKSPAWDAIKQTQAIRASLGNYNRSLLQPSGEGSNKTIQAAAKRFGQALIDESERDRSFIWSNVYRTIPNPP